MWAQHGGSPAMDAESDRAHGRHSRNRREKAKQQGEKYVCRRPGVCARLKKANRLVAERGEGCEAAAEPDDEQAAEVRRRLEIHEGADQNTQQQAPGDVYEERAVWKA